MRLARRRRAEQSADKFIAEFDLLLREGGSKLEMGAGSPERIAPILRMRNAGVPRQDKSLSTACSHKSLKFEGVAANLRRLFGSRG